VNLGNLLRKPLGLIFLAFFFARRLVGMQELGNTLIAAKRRVLVDRVEDPLVPTVHAWDFVVETYVSCHPLDYSATGNFTGG
jgi:hypothetical protein